MAKYRVTFVEKSYYETYVEADGLEEAEEKANEKFNHGDVEVTDCYVDDFCVEEEAE